VPRSVSRSRIKRRSSHSRTASYNLLVIHKKAYLPEETTVTKKKNNQRRRKNETRQPQEETVSMINTL
jgi:hypothetical protein